MHFAINSSVKCASPNRNFRADAILP
nr:unnamed protein product [Callosobruchus chinensis]